MALKLRGAKYFRQRLICATLSGKAVLIKDIRVRDEHPGLREYEASLLRLIEKITNGCTIEIDVTGTAVYYKPGFILGGRVQHDCGKERSIGYFLEALVCLAPFGKEPLKATLTGITNSSDGLDLSVDLFRTVTLPNLRHVGIDEGLSFKILKRGASPNGGGLVVFECPIVKHLKPIQFLDEGKVKRIRGIAYSTRVSPQFSGRMIEAAKRRLTQFTGDVYLYADHYKGNESGQSPGFGLSLVAETTTHCLLSGEMMANAQSLPEDVAENACNNLLHEILMRGCVDTPHQSLMFLLMALGPEDVSKIRVGKLSPYSVEFLRNLKQFFGVTFKIEPDPESKTVILTCLGVGFKNFSRRAI
jgi:RNA 3'-terminal phosphate cyclase-like protein